MTETQEPCLAKIGKYWERADFIGVFQYSYTHGDSPMVGGYKAGQVSYPVAVVRFDGKLYQLKLDEIDFCEVKNETKKISVHRGQNKESYYNRNSSSRACSLS